MNRRSEMNNEAKHNESLKVGANKFILGLPFALKRTILRNKRGKRRKKNDSIRIVLAI